jgi:VWFA-related protein
MLLVMSRFLVRFAMRFAVFTVVLLAAGGAGAPAPAQPPPTSAEAQQEARLRVAVDVVNVEVTVTDARGNFVRNLKRENFRILDDGVEQAITHFDPVEAPAQALLLIETGPAVALLSRAHIAAVNELLASLAAEDRAAIVSYDESPRLIADFTRDKQLLAAAAAQLNFSFGRGDLRLYDSLSRVLDWISGQPGKKAVVLVGTGLDFASAISPARLVEKLSASQVTFIAVALGGDLRKARNAKLPAGAPPDAGFARADRDLTELAAQSGGRVFFPRSAEELARFYRDIGATLRSQYSLGFAPALRDARFHRLEVRLLDDAGRLLASSAAPGRGTQKADSKTKSRFRLTHRAGYFSLPLAP